MKPVGLLGGTSWVSTTHYYEKLNRAYQAKMGGLSSAPMLIYSVDFANIAQAQTRGDWDHLGQVLGQNAQALERAGAGSIAIGANTMHRCFDAIQSAVDIEVLHIADGIAQNIGDTPTLLLGTAYTMESDFLISRLRAQGCQIEIPNPQQRAEIHRIIFEELCQDLVIQASCDYFKHLAESFDGKVLLACTELGLVLDSESHPQVVDSLDCHVAMMLEALATHNE